MNLHLRIPDTELYVCGVRVTHAEMELRDILAGNRDQSRSSKINELVRRVTSTVDAIVRAEEKASSRTTASGIDRAEIQETIMYSLLAEEAVSDMVFMFAKVHGHVDYDTVYRECAAVLNSGDTWAMVSSATGGVNALDKARLVRDASSTPEGEGYMWRGMLRLAISAVFRRALTLCPGTAAQQEALSTMMKGSSVIDFINYCVDCSIHAIIADTLCPSLRVNVQASGELDTDDIDDEYEIEIGSDREEDERFARVTIVVMPSDAPV
jgi:hypothetical protein